VAWPHRSCLRTLRCATVDGSRTCTISLTQLRFPLSISRPPFAVEILVSTPFAFYQTDDIPFPPLFATLILPQPRSPVPETPLKFQFTHPHNTTQMLSHVSSIFHHLPHSSTITLHALIASSTSFVCIFFFWFCRSLFSPTLEVFPVIAFLVPLPCALDRCICVDLRERPVSYTLSGFHPHHPPWRLTPLQIPHVLATPEVDNNHSDHRSHTQVSRPDQPPSLGANQDPDP